MVLDPNKPVVIFSHPRSGSTWIQDSLPQFNLSELFTLYCKIKSVDLEKGIHYEYSTTAASDIDYRFELFELFKKRHTAISVKIQLHLLTRDICKFFEGQELQYVLIDRTNKLDTFWSLLIALHTLEFHNTLNTKKIVVTKELFLSAKRILNVCENTKTIIREKFKPTEIIYENFIQDSSLYTTTISKKYIVQNSKNKVVIENIEEVTDWLKNIVLNTV